jgi:HEAT repeat protein
MTKDYISSVVINNYASGRDICESVKLRDSCEELPPFSDISADEGLTEYQCEVLGDVLGRSADGEITEDERERMSLSGLPFAFIDAVAGPDGRNPIYQRVDVIKNTIFQPPTSINLNVLREIEEIGPDAIETLPALLKEIDFLTEGLRHYQNKFPNNFEFMDTTRKSNRAVQFIIGSIVGMDADTSTVIESLIEIFDDDVYNGKTHAKAAQALGFFDAVDALTDLKTAVWGNFLGFGIESSDEARVQAALAAASIDETVDRGKVVAILFSVLRKYNNGSIGAARALGEIDSVESRRALMQTVRENPDYKSATIETREEAARSLGKLKAIEAIGTLSKVLEDEPMNGPVCRAATWALGEIGTVYAIEPLKLALRNGAASVHYAAAEALMKIDENVAIYEITEVMKFKGDNEERLEKMAAVDAARALIEIGPPEVLDEIEKTMKDPDVNEYVRIGLYRLLSQRTDREIAAPDKA